MNEYPTPEEQPQTHDKIPVKWIICIILAVILGVLMITHDAETFTAQEKTMIVLSFLLSAVTILSEPLLKEWIQKDSGKRSQRFLKNGICELWAIICSFALISATLFGFRFVLNLVKENYFPHNPHDWFFSDSIMTKSWLIGNTPATITGSLSCWTGIFTVEDVDDIANIPMDDTVTAAYVQEVLSFGHDMLKIPDSYAQKIADFLNTPIESPVLRFFLKWFFCITSIAGVLCIYKNTGFPSLIVILVQSLIALGAVISQAILQIAIIFTPIAVPCSVMCMAIFALGGLLLGVVLLMMWGACTSIFITGNLILWLLFFLSEKITEKFFKGNTDSSAQ